MEKKNLEDKRAELRNKERELQDIEEKHQVRIVRERGNVKDANMGVSGEWMPSLVLVAESK